MRLLVGFVAISLILVVVVVWQFLPARSAPGQPPSRTATPVRASPPTAPRATTQSTTATRPVAPAPDPPAPGPRIISRLRRPGQYSRAQAERRLALAQQAIEDDPHHEQALRDAHAALVALQRWEEASDLLSRLVTLCPDDADLRFEYAAVLMQLRRFVEALVEWRTLSEQDPGEAVVAFNLAVTHQQLGHLAEARRAWDAVIALDPTPTAHIHRGEVLLQLDEPGAAIADFRTALAELPHATDAVLNLAQGLRMLARADEATEWLNTFLDAHPQNVPVLNRLAEYAWEDCQVAGTSSACEDAVKWARRSLAVNAAQPAVRTLLNEALARLEAE